MQVASAPELPDGGSWTYAAKLDATGAVQPNRTPLINRAAKKIANQSAYP
jgi:hypothetical protein